MSPIIADADPINPTFTVGWLDYAQARGCGTDPARVRSPKDKPRVERIVQYVRGNFFAGEVFTDLPDAQRRAEVWCTSTAGLRLHGSTYQRPGEQFAAEEAPLLLPVPAGRYDVPIFATPKGREGSAYRGRPRAVFDPSRAGRAAGAGARGLDAGEGVSSWAAGQDASTRRAGTALHRPGQAVHCGQCSSREEGKD